MEPVFHESWYSEEQCRLLAATYEPVRALEGMVVEIGCWEGRSTIALANACYPDNVVAIDTWRGNVAEASDHLTIALARERDIFAQFQCNVRALTRGNVAPLRMTSAEFLGPGTRHYLPIKFGHVDASHDYWSVRADLCNVKALLHPAGILCGDDFEHAHAGRADLDGGVERAVREVLPGFQVRGNFWWWTAPKTPF